MKKHLKKWLPLVLAAALLIGLLPVSGIAFAAEDRAVALPDGYVVVSADGKDMLIDEGNTTNTEFNGLDMFDAPDGAMLAFYFDTTTVVYDTSKGDKNNYAFHLDVDTNTSSEWQGVNAPNSAETRVFLRDGQIIEDAGQIGGEEPTWIFTLPSNAAGYVMIKLDGFEVNTLQGIRIRTEHNWNDNLDNQTIQIRNVGYVAVKTEEIMDPPEGFVLIDGNGIDHVVNDGNTNGAIVQNLDTSSAPDGSKLALYFDTTAVAYDTSKNDMNNWAVHIDVILTGDQVLDENWKSARGSDEKYSYSRIYERDGEIYTVDGYVSGQDPSEWIVSIPSNAKGYLILNDLDAYEVNDISAVRLYPSWGWNENLYNQTIKIRNVGYISSEQPKATIDPPEGFVSVKEYIMDCTINESNSDVFTYEGYSAPNAPAGSKLAFYFDTTAVAYDTTQGDKNNYAAKLSVWSNTAGDWIYTGPDATNEFTYNRIYLRDGQIIEDTRVPGQDPGTWTVSFPVNAKGWMIVEMDACELTDITAFKLASEWNWNDNLDNKTIKIGNVGYIPGEETPESSEEESSAPESSEEESSTPESSEEESSAPESSTPGSSEDESIMDPPEDFVLIDKNGLNHVVNHEPNGNSNTVSAYLNGLSAPDAPVGSKLVFYFDTTAIQTDSSLGDKDNWAVYIDALSVDAPNADDENWQTLAFPSDGSAITRIICRDGETLTVEGRLPDIEPSFLFTVPTNATGYMIIDMGQIDLNTIQAIRLRPEWNWNKHLWGETIKIRNIGYIPGDGTKPEPEESEPDTPVVDPDDFPFVPEPSETPDYYGTNYVVTNPDLQELKIDDSMKNDLVIDLTSNANAPEGAKAIVFRYNTTGIPETRSDYTDRGTHASYWSLIVDDVAISGNIDGAGDYKYVQHNQVYYWRDQVMENSGYLEWINTLPVNGIGYVIINIDDLQAYAQKFLGKSITVADVDSILMKQEWFWNVDMYNQTIRITDVGYLMDPAAFIASYKDSYVADYLKGPMAAGSDIVAKADSVEGTFAELSWNEYEGANRYFINVYDEDGNYLLTERTRKTSLTLEGLDVSTGYKIQILATGDEDAILSVSNVLEITTLEENLEAYMKDVLEYDPTMTATGVELSGDKATIKWDWITGVGYYTVHLYEKDGDTLTFVSRTVAEDGVGEVTVSGLEKGKTYVAQIVSYDVTDSIIYAYVPTDAFEAKDGVFGGDSSDKDNAGSDNPDTGVSTCVGVVALASLLAGGVTVVTRKRR